MEEAAGGRGTALVRGALATLYTLHYTLYCTLYIVHCKIYILHCTVYTVDYIAVHYTLYILH